MMNRSILLISLAAIVGGCASQPNPRVQAGLAGEAHYQKGEYRQAEPLLTAAVTNQNVPSVEPYLHYDERDVEGEAVQRWALTLAHLYWETERPDESLAVASEHLDLATERMWRCRVSERREYLAFARSCYQASDDPRRVQRVIRQQELSEFLAEETP